MFVDLRLDPCKRSVASIVVQTAMQDYLLFGKPLRALTTKSVLETCRWPRMELGYGNNVKDWAIRSVTLYVRYAKDTRGIQRLNGNRSVMTV